ncbi:sensor histidine kinase [Actinomadura madurae]|uniref:sensor histidine kinase n=1 Tax=Actinomadura madurae TaxID=1993 RepID=UPI0020D24363|nr:histidine kinase [Actinomadura madurae]MCQ0011907.1 histidine kinase [Actinomadura madurae]
MVTAVIAAVLVGLVVSPDGPVPDPAAVAMLVLQLVHCLPRTRRFRDRFGAWTLAAQVLLLPLGGPAGFLGASVLLMLPRPVRGPLFAIVVAAAGSLDTGSLYSCLNAMGNALCQGLLVYALTRLSDLRDELATTRGELAARSVAMERARVSVALEDALGTALSEIIRLAAEGRAEGVLERARAARAEVRRAPEPPTPAPLPPPGDLTPRTALPIIVIGHLWYPVIAVIYLVSAAPPPTPLALYIADIIAVVGLQVYHVLPRPPGAPPRHAVWTLPAQALLATAALLAPDRPYPQLMWLAAGAVLVVLAARPGRAWRLFAGYVALVPSTLLVRGDDGAGAVLWTIETASGALMFYGLALLTRLVHEIAETRAALALTAVAQERRRIARDVHDLLGAGLWAIMLKADLATRDPGAADEALTDAASAARSALGDLRAIPGDDTARLSAATELRSALDLLAAAGVEVTVTWPPDFLLPPATDALFATVLREAATNVMRHSAARHCLVEAVRDDDRTRVRVVNDGTEAVPSGPPGQGLANLTARAGELGGTLTARPLPDGRFELSVDAARPARATCGTSLGSGPRTPRIP